jgi:Cu(I)/Ag(I) efflux system membrane fusion protein
MRTICILLLLILGTACSKNDKSKNETAANQTATHASKHQYFCPMHPHIKSDKPGVCPICGMDLVLPGDEDAMGADITDSSAMLILSAQRLVLADVRTVRVSKESIAQTLTLTGALVPSESAQRTIIARVSGRVERLFVRQTGERVREGQPLYEVYSPALVQAQSDFLLTLKSVAQAVLQEAQPDGVPSSHTPKPERMRSIATRARERLLLLGMTNTQIDAITQSGEPQTRVIIQSPASGTVTQKNIVEGASLQEGASLFDLADFSTVWNIADVFEQDISALRVGQRVNMRFAAYPSETFQGRVSFLYPTLNAETRTVKVRIEAANPHGKLRPGMFSETEVTREIPMALTVPEGSVILSGKGAIVWVQESIGAGTGKETFRAQTVRLGVRNGGKYEILSGLHEGDIVAASGGFLLDSERQLRGGGTATTTSAEHNHNHASTSK